MGRLYIDVSVPASGLIPVVVLHCESRPLGLIPRQDASKLL